MADIKLVRPSAGQTAVIPSAPDARMVLDFSADQVSIERPQGSDSLFFRFDDGAAIELQNFYTQYNKDDIPSFEVDGQLIAGADFFNAFGPDLAPAAGPSASPTRSGRYSDFANAGLENGVNHLDGLDYRLGFGGDTQPNINPYASPFLTNAAPTLSTGGAAIAVGLTERAWSGTGDNAAPDSQRGSFYVADPDGDSLTTTVSMGGKVVAVSTAGPTTVESDYGTLVITPRGGGSNVTFEYTYTLKQTPYSPTDSLAEGEKQADNIVFSISDGKGHTVTQPINVVITGSNDAPDITGVKNGIVKDDGAYGKHGDYDKGIIGDDERDPITASGTADGQTLLSVSGAITAIDPDHGDKLTFGFTDSNGNKIGMVGGHAEGIGSKLGKAPDGSAITVTDVTETSDTLTIKTDYGTLTLTTTGEHAGEYTFTLNNSSDATNALSERDSVTLTLHPTVSDLLGATDGSTSIRTGGAVDNLELTIKGSNDLPTVTSNSWASTHGEITEDVKNTSGEYKIIGTIEGHDVDHGEAATLHYGFAFNGKMESTLYVIPNGTDAEGKLQYSLSTVPPVDGNYYGTLTITGGKAADDGQSSSATYSFELNNSADCVQALDDSSSAGGTNWNSLPVTVPVVVMDKAGGYVQQDIHLDIKGTNDAPVFTKPSDSSVNTHDVKEDGVFLAGERSTVLAVGENTTATSDANGSSTDGLTGQSDIKPLHEFVVSGSVAATDVDGQGKSDTLTYSLVNEGGTQNGDSTIYVAVTYNDTTHTWNAPTYSTTAPADGAANYLGKLVMGADGHYTFTLANDGHGHATGAANALGEGESIPLTFTPAVSDGTAYNTVAAAPAISITVHGTNDAPQVNSDTTQVLLEFKEGTTVASETKSGIFAVSDADASDKITFGLLQQDGKTVSWGENGTTAALYLIKGATGPEVTNVPPVMDGSSATLNNYYGKITISADAAGSRSSHYSLEVYNNSSAINELNQGQELPLTFTVVAGDQHGAYTAQTINATITGTNDAPSFNNIYSKVHLRDDGVHDGNLQTHAEAVPQNNDWISTSDHRITVENSLSTHVTDADKDAKLTYSIDTNPSSGDFLKEGSTLTAKSNDGNVVEVKIESVANGKDTQIIETNMGTLTLDKHTGDYTFELKNTSDVVNRLAEGEYFEFSFRSVVTDEWNASDHHMLSLRIEGANDKPTLSLSPEHNYSSTNHQYEVSETANTNVDGSGSNPVYALGTAVDHDDDNNPTLTFGLALGVKQEDAAGKIAAPAEETGKVSYTVTDGVVTMKGTYGTLSIDGEGKFSYEVDNSRDSAANTLAEGATGSDTFTILVKDEHGAWTAQPVTVQVTGVNDPPYLMGGNSVNVTESGVSTGNVWTDGTFGAKGELIVKDPDSGLATDKPYNIDGGTADADGWITKETDYGTLRLNPGSGAYEYTLNNSSTSTNNLAAGATHTDKIAITVTDSKGAVLHTTIDVNITGTNDRPTLDLGSPSVQVSEDGTLQFTGKFDASNASDASKAANVKDVDAGDSHKFYLVQNAVGSSYDAAAGSYTNSSDEKSFSTPEASGSITGTYGTLTMQPNGSYTYTLNNNSPAVQGLTASDHATETFYVMVKDKNGAFDIKPLTVTVNGQDDKVHLATTDVQIAQATESGVKFTAPGTVEDGSNATGKLTVVMPADADAEGGANNIQFGFKIILGHDSKGNEIVEYARPIVGEQGTTYVIEGCGTLTIDKYGNYSFKLDNDSDKVNALNAGQKESLTTLAGIERIELAVWGDSSHAKDFCSTQTLEVTINGTNDKPYFTVETGGKLGKFDGSSILSSQTSTEESLSEDSAKNSELHGKLTGDDVDAADTPGNLKFSLVEKDASGGVAGLPQVLEGKYGFLHLSEDGSYVYTLTKPSELQSLNSGDISTDEVFTVRVRDALGAYTDKTLVIELTGEKDAPHISATNPAVKESGYHDAGLDTATGNFSISVTDAQDAPLGKSDNSVTYSYAQDTYEGKYGTLTVKADGSYSYKLKNSNADIDKLNVGDSATDSFTFAVTATAGSASVKQDVTINVGIAGTNDAPVLSGTEVEKGIVWKGVFTDVDGTSNHTFGSVVATGHVSGASDVDDSTSNYMLWNGSSTVAALQTEYGTITMNADGSYSYYLDTYSSKVAKALADAKAEGRPLVDTISYKAVDPHNAHSEQTKTIEIKISDIVPGFDVGDLGRYGFDRSSTLASVITEDNGDPTKTPGSATPPDGTLSVHGEVKGTWTLLGLVEWDSNHGFGIKGAGNTQVQSSAGNGEIAGRYGYIVIDPMTGKYTYTLFNDSAAVQSLSKNDSVTETFTLMQNGHVVQEGGKDVTITITIHGTNDNPVITTAQNSTITEDAANTDGRFAAEVTGKLVATDVDADETKSLTWEVVGAGPQHGSVEISKDANGQWTYTYKVSDSYKSNDLKSGEHATDTFTVQVLDGNGGVTQKEITITFEGKNNVPTGTDATLAIDEDTELTPTTSSWMGDLIKVQDDRGTADLSFTVSNSEKSAGGMVAKGTYGTLFLDGKGHYTYSLNNASDKVQALHAGQNVADTFYVTITDSEGGVSAPVKVEVNITGTNDAPLLNLEKVLLLREGHTETETDSGIASVIDKDDGDKLTYKISFEDNEASFEKDASDKSVSIEGKYGTLTLNSEGKYTYKLTNRALGEGEKADEKFTITVADDHGGTVSKDLTVSIVGANDAPVITIEAFERGPNGSSLAYSDADAKDTLSLWVKYNSTEIEVKPLASDATTGTAVIKDLGTFTFSRATGTGAWTTYTFVAESVLAEAIRDGQYGDAITVAMGVSDGHGSTVYANTAVQVEGANEAPVPTLADTHGYHAWSGVLATDAEHDALVFSSGTIGDHDLHFGSLHVDANGNYSYTFNTDEESLAKLSASDVLTDSFSYTVNDSAINGEPVDGELKFHVNADNWDGHGGQLLFAQENLTTHNYEASGGAGNDILIGGSHDDILYGGSGDDILYGGAGHNQLYGGDGNDTLYAGKDGDHLYGGAGNDHLYGGLGNDFLDGGANTFAADGGGNHLYGGAGNDVLVFHQGDTIDGGDGTDMLVVKGGSVDTLFAGAEHAKGVDGITGVEVMVSTSGDALNNLTDMAEIASKAGVSISTGSDGSTAVSFDASHTWTTTTQTASNGTVWDVHSTTITTDSGSEAVQVAVQHLTTNQGG